MREHTNFRQRLRRWDYGALKRLNKFESLHPDMGRVECIELLDNRATEVARARANGTKVGPPQWAKVTTKKPPVVVDWLELLKRT
jgi:hypothetical protein